MEIEKPRWYHAAGLAIVMGIATALGNLASSYLLLNSKIKEETEKAAVERRAKGAQLHCEKLQLGASLASEIEFRADRGYPNIILLSELMAGAKESDFMKVPEQQIRDEQLAFEKRASELIPFLDEHEAGFLNLVTLHHYVLTQMRTSKVPVAQRVAPKDGGFDANHELDTMRKATSQLASIYRSTCSEY